MLPIVIITGRLVRDIQLSYTPSQKAVASSCVVASEKYGENETTCFLEFVGFGKNADGLNKYFTKGKPIQLAGRIKTESWTDKESGKNRSKIVLMVDRWAFVPKDTTMQQGEAQNAQERTEQPAREQHTDQDIPF